MYKLYIVQGPRNDKFFQEFCAKHDCCGGSFFTLRDNNPNREETWLKAVCLRVFYSYADRGYNIAIYDDFQSNQQVASFVRGADVRGYSVEFVRLAESNGEALEWKECFL